MIDIIGFSEEAGLHVLTSPVTNRTIQLSGVSYL
jgi:hypothetical protein